MNRREIVINALNHRDTRPVPYTLDLTTQARERLIAHTGDKKIADKLGSFMTGVYYSGRPAEIRSRPGYFIDDYGVVWNRNGADKDIGVIEGFVIEDAENNNYEFPEFDAVWFRNEMKKLESEQTDQFKVANFGFTMFERCWTLMGMENVLTYMITCPEKL